MGRVAGNCKLCRIYRWTLHKDHIIPRWKFKQGFAQGNPEVPENIQRICANCHQDKSIKEKLEFTIRPQPLNKWWLRPAGTCKCGIFRPTLHRDHIKPRWKFKAGIFTGDPEDPANLQYICANCHEDKSREDIKGFPSPTKGKKLPEEFRAKLRIKGKGLGHKGWMKGKHYKEEHLVNMRLATERRYGKIDKTLTPRERWKLKHNITKDRRYSEHKPLRHLKIKLLEILRHHLERTKTLNRLYQLKRSTLQCTNEDHEEIRRLYLLGTSQTDLVSLWPKRIVHEALQNCKRPRYVKKQYTQADADEIRQLYQSGLHREDIFMLYRWTRRYVKLVLKDLPPH